MREKKKKDKLITNENCLLVAFRPENVATLPKADCAISTECMSGRVGNDIASAFMQIVDKVAADHPNVTELICWSESSVPQNRNSHISQAILEYLSKQSRINMVTMKYSLAGYSYSLRSRGR